MSFNYFISCQILEIHIIFSFLLDFVFKSTIFTATTEFVLLICSFLSLLSIYKYYGSLPETKKTLVTYLMRSLMITAAIYMLHRKTIRFFHILFPEQANYFYTYHTEFSCNLLSTFVPGSLFQTNLFFILCAKYYMMVNTMSYLSLDHDRLKKFALIIMIGLNIIEKLILLFIYGSLCPCNKLHKIEKEYGVNVSEIKAIPPISIIHMISLGLPELIYRIILLIKRRNQNR